MPDITMCAKEDCPRKGACYRATAKPNRWQSYDMFSDCNEDNDYGWFMSEETGNIFWDW